MKIKIILCSLLALLSTEIIGAADSIPEVTTNKGRKYEKVVVRQITDKGISIVHESGVATIQFDDLTD